jgi:hypothetical protein
MSIASPPAVDEGSLPEALRSGLQAIRSRILPDITVLAVIDNFVVLNLGIMERGGANASAELPAIYREATAHLFARVPLNFPNAEPYGLVTVPTLHRLDGQQIERLHSPHPTAQAVADLLGESDAAFWSWDWSGMPRRDPVDLVTIVEWARKRIRQG